ncbi:hypothetical protein Lpp27_13263, partial [Lacticaseibacillus paracasei subsp. paracasei CNCM I-4648]
KNRRKPVAVLLAQLSLRWPRLLRFGTTVFKIALNNLCEGKKEQFSNRTIEKLFLLFVYLSD